MEGVGKKMERFEEWKKRRGKEEHRGRRKWRLTYLSRASEGNWGNWAVGVCLFVYLAALVCSPQSRLIDRPRFTGKSWNQKLRYG